MRRFAPSPAALTSASAGGDSWRSNRCSGASTAPTGEIPVLRVRGAPGFRRRVVRRAQRRARRRAGAPRRGRRRLESSATTGWRPPGEDEEEDASMDTGVGGVGTGGAVTAGGSSSAARLPAAAAAAVAIRSPPAWRLVESAVAERRRRGGVLPGANASNATRMTGWRRRPRRSARVLLKWEKSARWASRRPPRRDPCTPSGTTGSTAG